ncbi:MAG: type II toxin-antitoxin system RelE/ParE family toxin [Candidatus Manganitrophaceae bacterium]|nr:MAG: type II toxin-antitoxin system RelE/ParE family toxin [Candidatus Manganitrophaceae bacterium]
MAKRPHAISWTNPALQNLLEIVQYIQTDKPAAARNFVKQIKRKVSRLARFPNSGRVVPEFPSSGLRELIVENYRIIYRILPGKSAIQILTVRHGARSLSLPKPPPH